jgi:hypothetical protein
VYTVILDHIADKLKGVQPPTMATLHTYKETVRKNISNKEAVQRKNQQAILQGVKPNDSPDHAARIRGRQKAVSSRNHSKQHIGLYLICFFWLLFIACRNNFGESSS